MKLKENKEKEKNLEDLIRNFEEISFEVIEKLDTKKEIDFIEYIKQRYTYWTEGTFCDFSIVFEYNRNKDIDVYSRW